MTYTKIGISEYEFGFLNIVPFHKTYIENEDVHHDVLPGHPLHFAYHLSRRYPKKNEVHRHLQAFPTL